LTGGAGRTAIPDRILFDSANVLYIAGRLAGSPPAPTAAGWDSAQVVSHLAAYAEAQADAWPGVCAGESVPSIELPAPAPGVTISAAAEALRSARERLLHALQSVCGETGNGAAADAAWTRAGHWSRHFAAHAMDLVEPYPALCLDPLVLNWVLLLAPEDPGWRDRQLRLLRQVERTIEK
jgi:hypothetical protein